MVAGTEPTERAAARRSEETGDYVLEASNAFAQTSAERNLTFAATIASAQSVDAAAAIYGAFARDQMRASSVMNAKIADACTAAAKQCCELATRTMEYAAEAAAPLTPSESTPLRE